MARVRAGADDRGQLLLVGAFALAVLLVALALVLNGAAATETLATGGGDTSAGSDALAFQRAVDRGMSGLVVSINRNDSGTVSDFEAAVADWDDAAARANAEAGVGTTVEVAGTDSGSRIAQDTPRTFTNASGTDDWTLASNVTASRGLALNVSRASLNDSCPGCFRVVATDGSDSWEARVTNSSNAITVRVENDTTTETCAVVADMAVVDFSAGTLGDTPCDWPTFEDSFGGDYDVRYVNGGEANGTYLWIVDDADVDTAQYGPGGPTVSPAIYTATVDVTYRTPSLTYTVTIAVDPGADL